MKAPGMLKSLSSHIGTVLVAGSVAMTALAVAGCGPTYPKCDDDADCHEGEYCVNGMCQQCRDDTDCAQGQQCAAGRCEPIENYCTTNGDCGVDEECQANRCVPKPKAVEPPPVAAAPEKCRLRSVYFEFDSSSLTPETREQLAGNAECMRRENIQSTHLTGLTDPRGTEEYNMALGDRRAQSARKYLESLGVTAPLSHSSMGEEMATGTDEGSWARDRRVEFK